MKIALWIIAFCEVIRMVQNSLQLMMMKKSRESEYMKTATDEFVKSLRKTDKEFVNEMLEKDGYPAAALYVKKKIEDK